MLETGGSGLANFLFAYAQQVSRFVIKVAALIKVDFFAIRVSLPVYGKSSTSQKRQDFPRGQRRWHVFIVVRYINKIWSII